MSEVDLIAVEYTDGSRDLSVAVFKPDKLIGPVPYKNGIGLLAPMVMIQCPGLYEDVKSAELALTYIHFRNVTQHKNAAGQEYPFKVARDKP